MIKLCLIVLLISSAGAFAAEKKKPDSSPAKITVKTDEVSRQERGARLSEISAIERSSGTAKVSALKPLLSDHSQLVRGAAAEAMGEIKDPAAFDELSAALKSADDHTRWGAVTGLALLGDRRAVPLLIPALSHPESNTRWKAAQALRDLKDDRAVDALIAAARRDKVKNIRLAAIEALWTIGGDKAAGALEALKNDRDPDVETWAEAASEKLKRK